jgi:hypothetical protein
VLYDHNLQFCLPVESKRYKRITEDDNEKDGEKSARLKGSKMEPEQAICPRCGHEHIQADECMRCGVVISKYLSIQRRKAEQGENLNEDMIDTKTENTSGQGRSSTVPPEIKRWNWGAFLLNFIWAIGNRTWIGLLALLPYVGIIMTVVLGFKGNEWAWKNKRWKSIAHFKRVQKRWSVCGVCLFVAVIALIAGAFFIAFHTGEPTTGEHVDSVDWLPSSATDISYYKRDGFGRIRNYECTIPEVDFLIFAEKKGWKLQQEENVLFYVRRYRNGGGVSVHYNRDSKRLFVDSSHN